MPRPAVGWRAPETAPRTGVPVRLHLRDSLGEYIGAKPRAFVNDAWRNKAGVPLADGVEVLGWLPIGEG